MKYLSFILGLLITYVVVFWKFREMPFIFHLLFIFSFIILLFFLEYSTFTRDFDAEIKIKRLRKKISIVDVIFLIILLFIVIYGKSQTNDTYYYSILIFLGLLEISKLFIRLLYKIKKPYVVFITSDKLIYNNTLVTEFKLKKAKRISF